MLLGLHFQRRWRGRGTGWNYRRRGRAVPREQPCQVTPPRPGHLPLECPLGSGDHPTANTGLSLRPHITQDTTRHGNGQARSPLRNGRPWTLHEASLPEVKPTEMVTQGRLQQVTITVVTCHKHTVSRPRLKIHVSHVLQQNQVSVSRARCVCERGRVSRTGPGVILKVAATAALCSPGPLLHRTRVCPECKEGCLPAF